MLLVRRGRLLSAGGDARTSRETGYAPTEAGAAAERATGDTITAARDHRALVAGDCV
jgi:hypothetical protein